MNARALAQVLLRVWGVMLVVWALASVGSVFLFFPSAGPGGNAMWLASGASAVLRMVVYFVAGALLIRRGDQLGGWLTSDIDGESSPPVSALEIEAVAFSILGLYLLVAGVRDLAGFAVTLVANLGETGVRNYMWQREWQTAIMGVVNIVGGIVLLYRRRNIAGALSKAWRVVRSREAPVGESEIK